MISAACHDVIRFAIARKITTLEFHATSGVYSYPSPSLKSGHFTCQFNRYFVCYQHGCSRLIAPAATSRYKWAVIMLGLIATLAAGLFSGASIYINLVEHPARIECGTASAVAQWAPSYRRATVMQATLAAIGFLSAIGAWQLGNGVVWLIGGILLGLVIPFTFIVILPTNRRLLSPNLHKESPEARQLLDRWSRLHAVRSLLSFSSFLVFLVSLSRSFY